MGQLGFQKMSETNKPTILKSLTKGNINLWKLERQYPIIVNLDKISLK